MAGHGPCGSTCATAKRDWSGWPARSTGAHARRLGPRPEAVPSAPDAGAVRRRPGRGRHRARLDRGRGGHRGPVPGRARRPVRERDRRWACPVRADRGRRPGLTPALTGGGRHPGATIEHGGVRLIVPDPLGGGGSTGRVTGAQRLRLVLALGLVNIVLASVALSVGVVGFRPTDDRGGPTPGSRSSPRRRRRRPPLSRLRCRRRSRGPRHRAPRRRPTGPAAEPTPTDPTGRRRRPSNRRRRSTVPRSAEPSLPSPRRRGRLAAYHLSPSLCRMPPTPPQVSHAAPGQGHARAGQDAGRLSGQDRRTRSFTRDRRPVIAARRSPTRRTRHTNRSISTTRRRNSRRRNTARARRTSRGDRRQVAARTEVGPPIAHRSSRALGSRPEPAVDRFQARPSRRGSHGAVGSSADQVRPR